MRYTFPLGGSRPPSRSIQSKTMAWLVFEGLDGAGKSTLIQKLQNYLQKLKIPYVVTREPGGTPLGEQIRKQLLNQQEQPPTPLSELFLFEASRAQLMECIVVPALKAKKWVLCDRFGASSVAFQGGGRGIPEEYIHWLNELVTCGLQPDLTVLLDLSVEEAMKRVLNPAKSASRDRMESEPASFHEKVRASYLRQASRSPNRWLVLDAGFNPDQLWSQLLEALKRRTWIS